MCVSGKHPESLLVAGMDSPATTYTLSSHWIADLILKVNACVGAFEELQDDDESRRNQLQFGRLLSEIAGASLAFDAVMDIGQARCIVYTASKIRRGIATHLRAAQCLELDGNVVQFPLAAYDLLTSAASDLPMECARAEFQPARRVGEGSELANQSESTMRLLHSGLDKLRSVLTDASLIYADAENIDASVDVMKIMCGRQTLTLVRNALNARAVVCFFDSVRVATGVMASSHALGHDFAAAIPDVKRAAIGRADAYAVQRLYRALELIVAAMMMGQAQRAEESGHRDAWSDTSTGQEILRTRHEIGECLRAYDAQKRATAARAHRTYCAQTPGYVSLLQEQAANIMLKTQESGSQMHRAIIDALSLPRLFRLQYGTCDEQECRWSYWEAVDRIQVWREEAFAATNDRRVAPISNAIAMVGGSAVMSATDRSLNLPVMLTTSAHEAMRMASKEWPPMSNFYGKDYALTERKVTAKAAKHERDPREVGEALGYRTEWVGFLSGARDCKRQAEKGVHADSRFRGAITSLAHAEMLGRDLPDGVYSSPMPAPYGASIHNLHGVALSMEPALLRAAAEAGHPDRSHLFEHADAHYNDRMCALDERMGFAESSAIYDRIVLERRIVLQDRIEKVSTAFKSWSGGAVATDLFHPFFLEVWRRFNANLRAESSPWHSVVQEWVQHYAAGTEPKRQGGASKLMHPWKCMHLQRGVARALLEEWVGEPVVRRTESAEARSAMRIQRCMLESVIALYDFAPWASHVMRRFCSIDERRYGSTGASGATGKRGRDV